MSTLKFKTYLFKTIKAPLDCSKLPGEVLKNFIVFTLMRGKKADKGLCVAVSDRNDEIAEVKTQLKKKMFSKMWYLKIKSYNILSKQRTLFSNTLCVKEKWLKSSISILLLLISRLLMNKNAFSTSNSQKTLIFLGNHLYQTVTCLNCSTPTEKISEFLDSHFKPIIFEGAKMPYPSVFLKCLQNYWLNWLEIFKVWFWNCLKAALKKYWK